MCEHGECVYVHGLAQTFQTLHIVNDLLKLPPTTACVVFPLSIPPGRQETLLCPGPQQRLPTRWPSWQPWP